MNESKHSVLIIEDSGLSIMILKRVLESDYIIHSARNGREGIEAAEQLLPDLILLDIILTDLDGYDVIVALKNSEKTKHIPVIFITGMNRPGDEEKGLALGAVDYITKPFSPATVRIRVRNQMLLLEQLRANQSNIEYNAMKYKLTSQAMNIALWDMEVLVPDPETSQNKFVWSQEFRDMLGFTDENDFPNEGRSWSDRLHPEDKERTLTAFWTHIKDRTGTIPYDVEYRLQLKNGAYRHFHAVGTSIRDSEGIALRVAGALWDVTEQKEIREHLEYRKQMRNALNDMAVTLLSQTPETFDITMSSAIQPVADAVGLSRIDIYRTLDVSTEKHMTQVYRWDQALAGSAPLIDKLKALPFSQQTVARWIETLVKGGVVNIHTNTFSEDESVFLREFEVKSLLLTPVFKDDDLWGVVAFQDNINDRLFDESSIETLRSAAFLWANAHMRNDKDLEIAEAHAWLHTASQKFEAAAHWYQSLLNAVPLMISVTDVDQNLTFVNKMAEDFLAANSADILGKPCNLWKLQMCETDDCAVSRAKRGIKRFYFDHQGLSYQVNTEFLHDLEGSVSGFIKVMQDITESQQLAKERADAEAANKAKSAFLAMMSHEIRTPMNAIWGLTEILIQDTTLSEETQELLNRIHHSCGLLLGIINDILDFSKIEAGKLEVILAPYDIASLVNDVVHMNLMRIGDKPIDFELRVDENLPEKLVGDELRVKQILGNLLSNAFKYTDAGSVVLSVSFEPNDESVLLIASVRDTGHGLTPEQLSMLFSEYSRFEGENDHSTEGTGLGLSITRRLLDLMSGEIMVESEPKKGSTFTVHLPQGIVNGNKLGKERAENLQQFRVDNVTSRSKTQVVRTPMPYGSVLIVDDMEPNIYVAVRLLKPYGLKIDTATSGRQTIDKIKSGKIYDVIFMDHMMPQMDGIETTKHLRDWGYTKPIVALTANAVVGQSDMFLQNGFDAFISKPIDIRLLNSVLNKFVRDKQSLEVTTTVLEQKEVIVEQPARENTPPVETVAQNNTRSILAGKNINGLSMFQGIARFEGDEKTYLKFLRSFAATVRSMLGTVDSFCRERLHDYEIVVHGIKGACMDIFAEQLGKAARDLEMAAKHSVFDFIESNNSAFLQMAWKLIGDIENMLAVIEAENPRPKKEKPDAELLAKLLVACQNFDTSGADEIMSEIDEYQYESDDGLTDWLRDNVDVMNFEEIVKRLT